jgi:hypothetical protein
MSKWQAAPEIRQLAEDIIKRYPGQFGHLADKPIQYVWREKHRKLRGKQILGIVWIQGGLPAIMIKDALSTTGWAESKDSKFFMMEIAMDTWQNLTDRQREALVAHELCHLGADDEGNIMTLPHDIEEFSWIAQTYGPWKDDLRIFGEALMDNMELDARAKEARELRVPGRVQLLEPEAAVVGVAS